jgi:hypothetical protein
VALGNLQEEPSAGKPHARICEGESRMAELLDQPPRTRVERINAVAGTGNSLDREPTALFRALGERDGRPPTARQELALH